MRYDVPLHSLCAVILLAGAPLRASKPPMNELLVALDTRRVSAEEALRGAARNCPAASPRLQKARTLYRDAREASNAFLQQMALDLAQDSLQGEKSYRAKLQKAQEATEALILYLDRSECDGTLRQAKALPALAAALLPKLPDFIGWIGDRLAKRREEAKQRRTELVASLKEMRWAPFDEVVKGVEPASKPVPPEPTPHPEAPPREAQTSGTPLLRLETGLHTAALRALSVSRDGALALTASEDRTARLWEVATGRLLRTFRPTVEGDRTGMLYACALSPDGRMAALGGWTRGNAEASHRVFLVDTRTGESLRSLEVGPQVVNFLAFSPDGVRLVAHLGGNFGLRVYRAADGALLAQDLDFAQPSYRGAFDAEGRYAASGDDGFLRLFDPAFQRLAKVKAPAPSPFGLAFSPDGATLALAYADQARVDLLDARTLALLSTPAPGTAKLGLVAWSRDGKTLYASGGEDFGPAPNVLRQWQEGGRGRASERPLARATVSELLPMPEGGLAYAAQDPAWGLLDAAGSLRHRQGLALVDLRMAREAFRIDAQALRAALPGRIPEMASAAFSLADLDLEATSPTRGPRLQGLALEGWKDGSKPTLEGRPLPLEDFETSRSLDIAPDGSGFLLGSDWHLRNFDARGQLRWKLRTPAAVWGLCTRADGQVAVALLADGTLRWYRTQDGRELLACYVAPDRRWIAWTPSGAFGASVGGEGLAGWQLNRPERLAEFFPMSHFRDGFCRPTLLPLLLETLDEGEALRRLQPGTAAAPPAIEALPPTLALLSPGPDQVLPAGKTTFQVEVRSFGPPKEVKGFQVFLDGRRQPATRGLRPQPETARLAEARTRVYPVEVDLPEREVRVEIQAELEGGRLSERVGQRVHVQEPAVQATPKAPTLRLLAVGVSRYADPRLNLQFPAKDAADVARCFQGQEGRLFGQVEVTLLRDEQATKKGILEAMDRLRDRAHPEDVTVYFFSSHGGTNAEKSTYFLINHDFGQGNWGVDGPEIKARLDATPGKTLLLMDTCHSGNVLGQGRMRSLDRALGYTRFINELLESGPGTQVFSSSTGAQYSLESPAWDNGAFTKALREGLAGAADPRHTGRVTTDMLEAYLRQRVAELTRGSQTPVVGKSEGAAPFPLAVP